MSRRIVLVDIGSGLTLSGVLPSVALHGTYNAKLIARGGVAPYTFTTSSHLPSGLTLDGATGVLSADDVAEAGTFALVVTVTDLSGASVTREFSLQVVPQPLTVSGSAPDGAVNVNQTYTYTISGGMPPYNFGLIDAPPGWSVPDAAVPTISITAEDGGLKTWIVRVTDNVGSIIDLPDSASFSWTPATLFASGEQGCWAVLDDLGMLFQDTSATIPVTAVGQPVRRINDQSGGGRHLVGLGTLRELSGHRYIECNGTTSGFSFAGIGAGQQRHLTLATKLADITNSHVLFEESANYNAPPYGAFAVIISAGKISLSQRVSAGTLPAGYTQKSFGSTLSTNISSFEIDRTAALASDQLHGYSNGVEQGGTLDYSESGFGVPFVDTNHYVGSRATGLYETPMSFFGLLFLNRPLTDVERGLLVSYFADLTGLA